MLRSYISRNEKDGLNGTHCPSVLLSVFFKIWTHCDLTQQGLLDHAVGYIITRRVIAVNSIVGRKFFSIIQNTAYFIYHINFVSGSYVMGLMQMDMYMCLSPKERKSDCCKS